MAAILSESGHCSVLSQLEQSGPEAPESPLRLTLEAADPARRAALLEAHVREQIGRVLRLDPQRIPADASFASFGVDSLSALEFRNRLESTLGKRFSSTLVWAYPNLQALVRYLSGTVARSEPALVSPAYAETAECARTATANAVGTDAAVTEAE